MRYSYFLPSVSDQPVLTVDGADPPQVGDHVHVPAAWCPETTPPRDPSAVVQHRVLRIERRLRAHGEEIFVALVEQVPSKGKLK